MGQLLLHAPRSAQIDLPIDLVVEIRTVSGKHHLDLELGALALQPVLANDALEFLLRRDSDLFQILTKRHIKALVLHG